MVGFISFLFGLTAIVTGFTIPREHEIMFLAFSVAVAVKVH